MGRDQAKNEKGLRMDLGLRAMHRCQGNTVPGRASAPRRICRVQTLFVALLVIATATATASAGSTLSVASDGRDFLALWNDQGLNAAIVRDAGGVTRSVRLGTRKTIDAAAAWNGESYIVAWIEVEGVNPYNYRYFAHWARVSAAGEVLDVFDASPKIDRPRSVGLAANGGNTLIVWTPWFFSVVLDLVDRDGHLIHETSSYYYSALFPHVVADGDGFIMFVRDEMSYGFGEVPPGPWRITAQRVDTGGNLAGGQAYVDEYLYASGDFGIARSGTQFVLARTIESPDFDPSRKSALRTRTIGSALQWLDLFQELQLPAGFNETGIICDGVCTVYVHSGHADGGVLTLRVGAGAPASFLPPGSSFPRIAWSGRTYLVLWDENGTLKSLECDATLQPLPGATPQPIVPPPRRRAARP